MDRIAIDMDEVIVDTLQHQLDWFRRERGESFDKGQLAGKAFFALASSGAHAAIEAAMQEGTFFGEPEPMAGAIEVFRRLCEKFDVYIASAAMDYPNSCGPKVAWVRRHLPFFDLQRLVFCGDKRVVQADYLIDDSPRHFAHFRGRGLLFSAPHNAGEKRFERVDDWAAVARRFAVEGPA